MENENLIEELNTQGATPTEPSIELSDSEKAFIEAQREENARLRAFRDGYQNLVNQTGYTWVVDLQSSLGSPKLGIAKVR